MPNLSNLLADAYPGELGYAMTPYEIPFDRAELGYAPFGYHPYTEAPLRSPYENFGPLEGMGNWAGFGLPLPGARYGVEANFAYGYPGLAEELATATPYGGFDWAGRGDLAGCGDLSWAWRLGWA